MRQTSTHPRYEMLSHSTDGKVLTQDSEACTILVRESNVLLQSTQAAGFTANIEVLEGLHPDTGMATVPLPNFQSIELSRY